MDLRRALGPAAAWTLAASLAAGCAGYPTNIASGGACVRTLQCGPGLVCSQGHCTNDLSMFGMGHATSLDANTPDAGMPVDAAAAVDANLPDTGVPPVDAFTAPVDTGLPPVDAFTPPVDAFTPPVDAFTPPVDAFTPPVDAFVPADTNVDAA